MTASFDSGVPFSNRPSFTKVRTTQDTELKKNADELLTRVMHPAINASLVELGIVKNVEASDGKIQVLMAFPFPGIPIANQLVSSVRRPLETLGVEVEISTSLMNEEEKNRFLVIEHAKWKQ
ncbi:MAG: iron-sulfur cluster assembly protein [Candidatus Thorarchaeota archaeon]|nr:MAG: metal-sulfur cluster biosynthetic enzyme [Candidatus Thorarchaeota archaeon]RLI55017.1 MAG: metal-sulfur cluster biosynthetic enzyme [Candidatus Thorarchaeota archaeon]